MNFIVTNKWKGLVFMYSFWVKFEWRSGNKKIEKSSEHQSLRFLNVPGYSVLKLFIILCGCVSYDESITSNWHNQHILHFSFSIFYLNFLFSNRIIALDEM